MFVAVLLTSFGVLLITIAERHGSDSLERAIGRELEREARHVAGRLSSILRTEQRTLASFARQDWMREIRVGDIDKRITQALVTLRDGSPLRVDYQVVDEAGRVVASSDAGALGQRSTIGLGAGEARLEGDRLWISARIPDPDATQRSLGVLFGVLDWKQLTSYTEEVREELAGLGLASEIFVCDAGGRVLGGAWEAAPSEAVARMLAAVVAGDRMSPLASPWIVGHARFAPDLPGTLAGQHLIVVEHRKSALAPVRALSGRLFATLGIVLLLGLAVASFGARQVARPLSELTGAIRGLAQGKAETRRVPVRSDDEVGTLAAAFNQMAGDLDRAQRDLIEAEKFAFVGELAAGVAHEIRTSLGVLRSSAQLLEQSLPTDADGQTSELAHMLGAEVDRLASVVNDLLTLDRPHPPRLASVRVSDPLAQAVALVASRAAERSITIEQVPAPDEPAVRCESELIHRVAVNLLVNAMEAVGEGGSIVIETLDGRGGCGGFEITDDGPGVPPELREKIFQPFVTGRAGGVGLGLTFVKRVIHDHHGQIMVRSDPTAGATFRVELPLADDPSEPEGSA